MCRIRLFNFRTHELMNGLLYISSIERGAEWDTLNTLTVYYYFIIIILLLLLLLLLPWEAEQSSKLCMYSWRRGAFI